VLSDNKLADRSETAKERREWILGCPRWEIRDVYNVVWMIHVSEAMTVEKYWKVEPENSTLGISMGDWNLPLKHWISDKMSYVFITRNRDSFRSQFVLMRLLSAIWFSVLPNPNEFLWSYPQLKRSHPFSRLPQSHSHLSMQICLSFSIHVSLRRSIIVRTGDRSVWATLIRWYQDGTWWHVLLAKRQNVDWWEEFMFADPQFRPDCFESRLKTFLRQIAVDRTFRVVKGSRVQKRNFPRRWVWNNDCDWKPTVTRRQ
jgi:hypothetical protein